MVAALYVMLIWGGSWHSAPATVGGFPSQEACERNRRTVEQGFRSMNTDSTGRPGDAVKTACVTLDR